MLILMVKKYGILLLGIAVAGVVGPMAYYHFFDHGKTLSQAKGSETPTGLTQAAGYQTTLLPEGNSQTEINVNITGQAVSGNAGVRRSNVQILDSSSVFNFQITPEWIVAHWPTASTGLAQLQLEGYRVPLVTGTALQDLAGSLTYYFNAEQKLQQITFVGTTGDPRPLIGLLIDRFRLTRRLVNDPGLIVYEAVHRNNQPASSLELRLAPVVQPTDSYRRYDIKLSLQRTLE
jgi:hypothetical protein